MKNRLVILLALWVASLGCSSCLADSIRNSLDVPHPDGSFGQAREAVELQLGEPIARQQLNPPVRLADLVGSAELEAKARLGEVRVANGIQSQGIDEPISSALEALAVSSEVFRVTGVLSPHNPHPSGVLLFYTVGFALQLELFGVAALEPTVLGILLLDVPLSLLAAKWLHDHKHDVAYLTYWYDENGTILLHAHGDHQQPPDI